MSETFDAVVIGGGTAGLSAALSLGRATRRVLLAACGEPRNAPAHAAHNVFTRDGTPPLELLRIGREQLAPYDVTLRDACVAGVRRGDTHYIVEFQDGQVETRGIVIATGVRDVLPDTPGFKELWGSGVFHCPYCHGWEVANRPLAIYAQSDKEAALHFAILIRGWTRDLMLFTDGPSELSADDLRKVHANGIVVREERVERLVGNHGLEAVVLEGGEVVPRAGLFMRPKQEQRSDIAVALGCTVTDQGRIEADVLGRTGVPRVFVAGDIVVPAQSVIAAAASGTMAGAGLNHDLLAEEFESGSSRS